MQFYLQASSFQPCVFFLFFFYPVCPRGNYRVQNTIPCVATKNTDLMKKRDIVSRAKLCLLEVLGQFNNESSAAVAQGLSI